jgi:hypothetical protein
MPAGKFQNMCPQIASRVESVPIPPRYLVRAELL